jgi:hypothetical protein
MISIIAIMIAVPVVVAMIGYAVRIVAAAFNGIDAET